MAECPQPSRPLDDVADSGLTVGVPGVSAFCSGAEPRAVARVLLDGKSLLALFTVLRVAQRKCRRFHSERNAAGSAEQRTAFADRVLCRRAVCLRVRRRQPRRGARCVRPDPIADPSLKRSAGSFPAIRMAKERSGDAPFVGSQGGTIVGYIAIIFPTAQIHRPERSPLGGAALGRSLRVCQRLL